MMQCDKLCLALIAFCGYLLHPGLCADAQKVSTPSSIGVTKNETVVPDLSWYLSNEHELSIGGTLLDRGPYELSPGEVKNLLRRILQRIDQNGDRKITQNELYLWINYVAKTSDRRATIRSWLRVNPFREKKLTWESYVLNTYGFKNIDDEDEYSARQFAQYLRTDKRRWKAADRDLDELLTIEEFSDFLQPVDKPHMRETIITEFLDSVDQDGDFQISEDEYLDELGKTYQAAIERGNDQPKWALREREQFLTYRDLNKDGKLDRREIGEWIVPTDYDSVDAEVQHIFFQADANRDDVLTEQEILDQQSMFIHSQAMNYGYLLKYPHSV